MIWYQYEKKTFVTGLNQESAYALSHTHTPTDYAMNSQLKCPQGHQNTKQANEADLMKGKRALLNTDSKPEFATESSKVCSKCIGGTKLYEGMPKNCGMQKYW